MNKHRTLKAVGFFVVFSVIVAFLALPDSQASKGKPIKWEATVLGESLGGVVDFVGGQDHVNINNGVGTNEYLCGPTGSSYSYIELQLFNPSLQFDIGGFSLSNTNSVPASFIM